MKNVYNHSCSLTLAVVLLNCMCKYSTSSVKWVRWMEVYHRIFLRQELCVNPSGTSVESLS
ncbi:hypothetical protein MBAV_000413 [Candidatus Magnetobacterium bavaricum]|uniref:Uncharacterized protein n=1 Tax=Candidatus Magnetobacterium bavaricum TaxID=29290 RepID=A0A0F3GZY3_9BACT|nr:hypothetical protein MBAV_000413 [Candidatus Magnetobacterium bavaricum]